MAFVVGAVLGYGLVVVAERISGAAPPVQWTAVLALVAIAVIVFVLAYSTYRTVHRERRRMNPQRAVNFLLLAKASALVGAVIAGGYVGFGLQFIDEMDVELPRERVIGALSAAVAALLIVVAGLVLERACRVPRDDDD